MHYLTVDIETSPTTDEKVIAELVETVKPPANFKKPETIEKWMDEHAQEKAQELINRTALDGSYGSIRAIGYAIDQRPIDVLVRTPVFSEKEILETFFELWTEIKTPTLVGHHLRDFDLPFIWKRAVINGFKPHPYAVMRYFDRRCLDVYDTMTEWAGWGKRISLSNLAYVLLGEEKTTSGADVWQMSDEEVVEHCKKDVELTRNVFLKMNFL